MSGIREIEALMQQGGRVHFIGIGGVSMSSLAMIAAHLGHAVTGSDRTRSAVTEKLEKAGIGITYAHLPENVRGAVLVVYTAAVKEDNPELAAALAEGIPVCKRAEFLGWLMSSYRVRIGVAGTHGKSTVTSMLAGICMAAGTDPTVVSGAALAEMEGAYRIGAGDRFIFEACEYCDSFLSFLPTVTVITNVEYDHADYFRTMEQMRQSYRRYMAIGSRAVVNLDDGEASALLAGYDGEAVTCSVKGKADYRAENIVMEEGCGSFDLTHRGETLCRITLAVPGAHNVTDALLAAAAAHSDGIPPEGIVRGLKHFHGAARRFEYMGKTEKGADVYNDYAHHPSELRATLAAAKSFGRRVVCVFQPHTYSRTVSLFDGFAAAFGGADTVIFTDIYAAREENKWGVSSAQLAEKVKNGIYLGDFASAASYLEQHCGAGDMIMILGAGDVIGIGRMIVKS